MTFGASYFLWLLLLVPVLIGLFFANERRARERVKKLVAARLLDRLASSVSQAKRRLRFVLFVLGFCGAVVALAQPRIGFTWETTKRKGRDIIIAIDTSKSMLATDVSPNRLTRAKLAAQDLIAELGGDRVGVIAFAGSAFLQAPLTVDYAAVLSTLNEIDTEIIPQGGSNIAAMIQTAVEAFGKGESDNRALIVFTDGEELDTDGVKAAEELKGEVRIFTVGLGSPEGALIPISGGAGGTEFVKDANGQIVKSRLDEDRLRKIAEVTGGFYIRLQSGRPEMTKIVEGGLEKMTEKEIDARQSRQPIERYQWPLTAAVILLASSVLVGERRRGPTLRRQNLLLPLPLLLLLFTGQASAVNPGVEAFDRKDYTGAIEQFSHQLERQPDSPELAFNLGGASYKAGKYEEALGSFSRALTSPDPHLRTMAEYNLANTLFQRGAAKQARPERIAEWKSSLQHYEEALKIEPENQNAIYNRDVVKKLLKEQEQQQQKQDQKQQQDKQDKQDKKDDQQKQDQKQDQQQKNQDQQGQDQKKDQQSQQGKGQQDQKDQSDQQQQPQEPKDQQKGDKGDSEKDQPSEPKDEKKDGEEKESDSGKPKDGEQKESQQPQSGKNGEQKDRNQGSRPEPMDDQSEKKEGELKSAQPGSEPQNDAAAQEAANAQAAAEGKMTPQQAKDLLESLKGEDTKVQLLDPRERARSQRVLKDW